MPAYTTHGWEIPGSIENYPKPETKKACGGPTRCKNCIEEVAEWQLPETSPVWTYDYTRYSDDTLVKVDKALRHGGLDDRQSLWAIIAMQNEGILFRERT